MSTEYQNNHYVPQWYQRRFIPDGQVDRELYLLDLKPETFTDGRGVKHTRKAVRRTGTRRCFAIDDLYTQRFGDEESRDLEKVFFGEVDRQGKEAVEVLASYDHDRPITEQALRGLMTFMTMQKLRTPKGLDWLVRVSKAEHRGDVLGFLDDLQAIYAAIWVECAWQLADATSSPTKLILTDHPVTIYHVACPPGHPSTKGSNDPDIRLLGSHTVFPLSADKLFILTNKTWACNPRRSPLQLRPHPVLNRGAIMDMTEIQTRRSLTENEVLNINWLLKKRAHRYIAAGRTEWLYPEKHVKTSWRAIGNSHLLMPDPRGIIPASEFALAYADGSVEAMDSFGRRPWERGYGSEARRGDDGAMHRRWCDEFEELVGTDHRGRSLEEHMRRTRELSAT